MAVTGITLDDEVTEIFNQLKLGKGLKYVIFRITPDYTRVVVEKSKEVPATWDDFVADLPKDDCRYAVYDYEFTLEDSGVRNKLVFVLWTPETAKIKTKMLYPATKEAMKRAFVGIGAELQATDLSEISKEAVEDKFKNTK